MSNYDDFLNSAKSNYGVVGNQDSKSRLNMIYQSVADSNPEQVSKVIDTSHKLQTHPAIVQNNIAAASLALKAPSPEYWSLLERQHPATTSFLLKPENMSASYDLVEEHAKREGFIQQIGHGYKAGDLQTKQGQLGARQMFDALRGKQQSKNEAQLQQIESEMEQLSKTAPKGFAPAYNVANQIPNMLSGAGKAAAGALTLGGAFAGAAALLGQAGPQVALPEEAVTVPGAFIAGAKAGGTAGWAESTFVLESGSAYRDFIKLKDKNGKPIDKKTAAYYAMAVGAVNSGIEMATLGTFLKAVPGGKKVVALLGEKGVKDLVKKQTAGTALKKAVGTYLKAIGAETGEEVLQQTSNVVAKSTLTGKVDTKSGLQEIAGVVSPTIQATAFNPLTILGMGSNTIESMKQVERARSDADVYRSIGEEANQSEFLKRVPSKFKELIEQQTAGSPVENVYVDAGQFVTLMQSMNPEVEKAAQIVAKEMGFGDQLQTALDTGGKIKVPLAEWINKTVQTEFYKQIEPHISFSEDGLTLYQAEQEEQRIQQQMQEAQSKAAETITVAEQRNAGYQKVYDDIKQKLTDNGKPAKIKDREWKSYIDKSAKLWAAHAVAESTRRGITVEEWYQAQNKPDILNVDFMPAEVPENVKNQLNENEKVFLESLIAHGHSVEEILKSVQDQRDQILHEQTQYLNESGGKGVQQGKLIFDEAGDVVERVGRVSNNPLWYRNFYKEKGRAPRKGEYKKLAAEMLKRGYDDEGARVPANEQFIQLENTLTGIRNLKDKVNLLMNKDAVKQGKSETRGFVKISPEKSIVGLLATADASTFLHESAHIFLNDIFEYSKSSQVDAEYMQDWKTLKDWLGVTDNQDALTTEQQETFARGFESYLFEGKTPSEGLKKAFAAFRRWLTQIYRDVKNLHVEISDPVRGVMDRMLATEDEIREREAYNNYASDLIKESDVSPKTWAKLKDLRDKAHEMAVQQLLKPQLDELKPERQEFINQERDRIRKIIEKEVSKSPLYVASEMLLGVFGRKKTSRELAGRYIKNDGFTDEGLAKFEAVAEANGFRSGDELAKKILAAPSFVEEVDERLEVHMVGQFGDLNDNIIEFSHQAEMAVRSEERIDVMALEREILLDLINKEEKQNEAANSKRNMTMQRARFAAQAAKKYAKSILETKPYREASSPTAYFALERQAAVAEAGCYTKKDYGSAAEFAQQRIINHALALESMKIKDEVEKIFKYFEKYQKKTLPKMNQEHLNQVQKILARFGLVEASVNAKEDETTLKDWIESRAEYDDAAIPEFIGSESMNYRDLTLGQLRDLNAAVKNIEAVDRNERQLITDEQKREFEEITKELTDSINKNNKVINPRNLDPNKSEIGKLARNLRGFVADHQKVEWIVRALDGYKDQGPVWRYVVLPMMRAMDKEFVLRKEAGKKYEELIRKYLGENTKEISTKKLYMDSLAEIGLSSVTKENLLAMALNMGNASNMARLLDAYAESVQLTNDDVKELIVEYRKVHGNDKVNNAEVIRTYKRNEIKEKIDLALDTVLEYNDWKFIQGVWDLINSYWPQIAEVEKLRKGVEPKKIEAVPVQTRFGTFPGGYYPVDYDPLQSEQASRHNEQESLKGLMEISYLKPSTKSSMVQERADVVMNRPLNLHLSVIDNHLAEVVHRISFVNAIRDVDKVLNDRSIMKAIKETQGDEVYKQFRPWLMAIGYEYRNPTSSLEKIFARARAGSSVVNMGLKMTTAFSQLAGIVPAMERLGPYRALAGMLEFHIKMISGKGKEDTDFVFGKSEMMKNRLENRDRDIKDATKKLIKTNKYDSVKDSYFYLIGLFDLAVTVPTWIQSYNKFIQENPKAEDEMAIRFADQIVRETQGSGDVVNMAAIQRGTEFQKLLTQFYSYFSVYANRQTEAIQRAVRRKEYGQLISFALYWWFFPAVVGELLAGRGADSGEPADLIKWLSSTILKYPTSAYVFVRDVVNALGSKYGGYEVTPSAEAVQKGVDLYNSLVTNPIEGKGVNWGKAGKTAFEFGGYWLQYPARQIETTVGNIYDAMTGESDFELRDLVFPRQDSRR